MIDGGATVGDCDSPDFDTGKLFVSLTANGSADDRLAIGNQGTGTGQIGVSGSNVTFEGTVIGTFAGGANGSTPLVVTLNANATVPATEALVRNITFANVSDDPATAARTVKFVFTDGDGGTSNEATKTIMVTEVNDAPTGVDDALSSVVEDSGVRTIPFTSLLANDLKGPPDESRASPAVVVL